MRPRVFKITLLFVAVALALAACQGRQTPQPQQETEAAVPITGAEATEAPAEAGEPASELGTLKVGYLPIGACAPIYIAYEKGYFEEQGLDVELQTFRTGGEMIAPLSLGQLDVGSGEVGTALFNAVSGDLAVKTVLPLSSMREGHGYLPLVVRKDLFDSGEVTEIANLKGRKIAVNAVRGVTEYFAAKALEQGGLTVDDVELVVIPFPEMVQALANKAVDAALLQHPLAGAAIRPGENGEPPIAQVLLEGEKIAGHSQNAVVYFGSRLLDPANHEAGVAFTVAFLKAVRDLQGDAWRQDDEIVNIIMEYTKAPEPAVRNGVSSFFDPNGELYRASMEDMQSYYLSRGYTEYTSPLSLDDVILTTFQQEALEILGEFE